MHVVAISVVKNEIDIVEPFVRHTLACVDRLLVLDNGSTDGTRQLLQELVSEGLAVEVLDDPEPGHYQWRRMTGLMREHAIERCRADWVVPLDADEFLVCPDVKLLLHSMDNRLLGLPWRTYVPGPGDPPDELNPVRRIGQRLKHESHPWIKVMVPAALGRQPAAMLDQGSHRLFLDGIAVSPVINGSGALAHFPGRSPEQFACKVAMKHLQYLAMTEREAAWGFHYQGPAARLRQGRHDFDKAFQDTILHYSLPESESFVPELVLDPVPYAGGELRYTTVDTEPRLLTTLWDAAEDLARRHAELAGHQRAGVAARAAATAALATAEAVHAAAADAAAREALEVELAREVARGARLTAELRQRDAAIRAMQPDAERWRRSWSCRLSQLIDAAGRWTRRCLRKRVSST